MSFSLDTEPFLAGLATAVKDLEATGERATARAGGSAGERAAALAPVESGELAASKYVVEGRDAEGFFVEVGFTADHAAENEFGTSTMAPRPFLRQALAEAANEFGRSIE